MSPFEPRWYESERARLEALAAHERRKTWGHPTDVLIVIVFVAVLTGLFVGFFG